jgi:hypothetical protein
METLDADVKHVKTLLGLARDKAAYRALGYASFDLMAAKECRIESDVLVRILDADDGTTLRTVVLGKPGEYGRGRPKNSFDNVKANGGNDPAYLVARLQRDAAEDEDAADRLKRFEAGGFRSVRQMAIDAGYVKEPTGLERLRRDWKKATDDERCAFLVWINE